MEFQTGRHAEPRPLGRVSKHAQLSRKTGLTPRADTPILAA